MCTIRSNQCIIRMPSTNTDSRNILPIRNRPIWNQKECSYRRRKSKTTKIWKATRHLSIKLREQDLQSRRSIVHSAVELKYLPDPSQTRNMEHWNGINLSSSSRLVKIYSGTFEISLIDWERGSQEQEWNGTLIIKKMTSVSTVNNRQMSGDKKKNNNIVIPIKINQRANYGVDFLWRHPKLECAGFYTGVARVVYEWT